MNENPQAKSLSPTRPAPIRPISLTKRALRWLAVAVFLGGCLAGGGYAIWQNVRAHVLHSPQYQILLDNVSITPPPAWIHTDIKAEVIRDAEVDGALSVLDEDLTERIYQGFAAHPWVAKVLHVAKLAPARLQVELVYRQPVCMVQVAGGLFPIDIEGVLLPTADFSPHEAARFPRLSNIPLPTEPPAGAVWRDTRVLEGARLAAALSEVWAEMGFHHFELMAEPGSEGNHYQILTRSGSRVFWGPAPGTDEAAQALTKAKLARLKQYYAERGSLDGPHGTQDLDLRRGGEIHVLPRTAMKPAP